MKKLSILAISLLLLLIIIIPVFNVSAATVPCGSIGRVNGWYSITTSSGFHVSAKPVTSQDGTTSSTIANGDISLKAGPNDEAHIDLYTDGSMTLSQLNSLSISGSGPYYVNLWFDTGNDGQFFAFDSTGKLTSTNGDVYGEWGLGATNTISLSNSDTWIKNGSATVYTITGLQNGNYPGINGNTKVAICIGNGDNPDGESTVINSITVNGKCIFPVVTGSAWDLLTPAQIRTVFTGYYNCGIMTYDTYIIALSSTIVPIGPGPMRTVEQAEAILEKAGIIFPTQ